VLALQRTPWHFFSLVLKCEATAASRRLLAEVSTMPPLLSRLGWPATKADIAVLEHLAAACARRCGRVASLLLRASGSPLLQRLRGLQQLNDVFSTTVDC